MEDLWERLVRAALRGRRAGGDLFRQPEAGLAANVPSSLANKDIDDILRAADEIQDDDPNVSRIRTCSPLCPFMHFSISLYEWISKVVCLSRYCCFNRLAHHFCYEAAISPCFLQHNASPFLPGSFPTTNSI